LTLVNYVSCVSRKVTQNFYDLELAENGMLGQRIMVN